jgi:uncharacterized membrane protein
VSRASKLKGEEGSFRDQSGFHTKKMSKYVDTPKKSFQLQMPSASESQIQCEVFNINDANEDPLKTETLLKVQQPGGLDVQINKSKMSEVNKRALK